LELLLIIMIVGALAIVALTQYKNMSERARFSEALVIMDQIRKAEWMYYQKSDHFCGSPDCLAMDPSIANSSTGSWGGHCSEASWFTFLSEGYPSFSTDFLVRATRCTTSYAGDAKPPILSPLQGYQVVMHSNGTVACSDQCENCPVRLPVE